MTGNAFVGVDHALTELGLWPQIKRFIGSSAGAIFAGCAACRIPYEKMNQLIVNTDFNKFCDSPWGIAGEAERIVEYMGLYNGDYFYNWYRNILHETIGDPDITFQSIYERFGSELVITTTDLTVQKLVYLNRKDNPDIKLCDAVRRSMSIPGFFIPIKEETPDGVVHIYVDGGCTNNFPLGYFDKLYASTEEAFGKTIGFNLETTNAKTDITNIIDLLIALIYTDTDTIEQLRLRDQDKYRIMKIPTFGLSFTDFGMPKENIQKLIDSGYNSAMVYFGDPKTAAKG